VPSADAVYFFSSVFLTGIHFMCEILSRISFFRMIFCMMPAVLFLLPLASCSSDSDEPEPDPVPAATERTLLVYMVARNTLGSYDYDASDIAEMRIAAEAGSLGNNRLIVFHSRYGMPPELKEITAHGVEVLKTYPASFVSVEPSAMNEVIADVKALSPSKSYGIVLWSHADGWLKAKNAGKKVSTRAFGDDMGRSMEVADLARVLKGKNFDFVYFDCCFMGGVEVAYQLRDVTPCIVASVSELPSDGMPYNITLPFLMSDKADPAAAAKATFSHYDILSGWRRTCTISVIDTSGLENLAASVRRIYARHPELPADADIQPFVSKKSIFYRDGNEQFFDLGHYLSVLTSDLPKWNGSRPDAMLEYEEAMEAIGRCVLYQASTPRLWEGESDEVKIEWHCGLSTFVLHGPETASVRGYDELDWFRDVASALF